MRFTTRFILDLFVFLLIIIGGCVGFMVIEGWDALEALYMTVITLTTVGFQEVHPLSQAGRIFIIFLIVSGVGFILYFLGSITRMMVEGTIKDVLGRRKLEKQIDRISGHFIICGFGRIGRTVTQLLMEKPLEVVVIEKDPGCIPLFQEKKILYVLGEATSEENLLKAGIERAKGLVAAASSDADNVYITLTARGLKPDLFVLARAAEESSIIKMTRAGADKVVSPYDIGARSMANTILRPTVIDFIELAMHNRSLDLQMEELIVGEKSEIRDLTLMDSGIRQDYDLIVVAIKKKSGDMIFNPSFQAKIQEGDILVALGDRENLSRLEKKLGITS
ncbi:MAG: potassium transporter TrkA [Deltaproteobacteria bacterium RBG_13_43_22]|nr:MAG: potassium transporter TrkA [Deltaproteobacteria bacterium RBG_13_43_22]